MKNTSGSQDGEIFKAEDAGNQVSIHIQNLVDIISTMDEEITELKNKIMQLEGELDEAN